MLTSTFRPIARQALRAQTRAYSSQRSTSSPMVRNLILGGSALATVTYVLSQRQQVRLEGLSKGVPRESVLDSHSLKEPIHRRDGGEKKSSEAPSVVQAKSVEAEETKGAEGAFNEETGEINWDCPCLGGMADGPCGEDFKAAFSCFVYSEAEPKGMDCVEKFKGMQDCFRLHPDIYGEEIDDEEPESGGGVPEGHAPERGVPAPPKKNPPENSPVLGVNPDETPSKGYTKIKPSNKML